MNDIDPFWLDLGLKRSEGGMDVRKRAGNTEAKALLFFEILLLLIGERL